MLCLTIILCDLIVHILFLIPYLAKYLPQCAYMCVCDMLYHSKHGVSSGLEPVNFPMNSAFSLSLWVQQTHLSGHCVSG